MSRIILQVALDLINKERAMKIADEALKGDCSCWIEVGTPLIKSEGMSIIRELKQFYPDNIVVADMKTIDTGALETEMAAKAGADVVVILGAADDGTIVDALKSARKYGSKIMVDLIGVKDKNSRAKDLEKLGVDYLCIHTGIDEQMLGKKPVDILCSIAKMTNVPIAAAGGINSESVYEIVNAGAGIVIVGGAITKAKDVAKATGSIRKAIDDKKKISSDLFKKYDTSQLKKAFSKVSTSNISDAMHKKGAMVDIHPIKNGFHLVGKALTVSTINGDWAKPVEAIDKAEEDQVLVIDVNGGKTAIWGELATWSAVGKKISGVVVDGAVRDIDDLLNMDFPVFSKHISPNAGEPKGYGEIGAEILCGGQTVRTGDWVIGDDSGVVVVPQEIAQEIANRALDVKEHENRVREEIKDGGSLGSVLKLKRWEKKIG